MASAYDHLQYLVNRCGDRRIGTLGNELAAEYITRVMESAGYACEFERFRSPGGIQGPYAAAMMMGFFASLLLSSTGKRARAAGLGLASLMAAAILGENTTLAQPAHRLVPRKDGRNVLARAGGSQPPAVLVVAHLDTVNEGTAFDERWVRLVPAGFRAYATFPLLVLALSNPRWKWAGRICRLAMLAGAASMVQWSLFGGYNPGANDNGSAVSVALVAAERLADEEARQGVWFLFTDGEEAGITGMKAFIKEHAGELASTLILNLESQGSGELCYLAREGMLVHYRPPDELLSLIDGFASPDGLVPQRREYPSFTTDALAAGARGLSAVTLVRLDENGLIAGWHHHDFIERVDRSALENSADYVADLLAFLRNTLNRK
jgi:hypothetical protein